MRRSVSAMLGLLACWCQACHSQAGGTWTKTSSAHFDYSARPGDSICPTALSEAERHYTWAHAYLGVDSTDRVSYYKYQDAADFAANSPCSELLGPNASGCASAGVARAYVPLHEHELMHAYTLSHWRMPRMLNEGLAVAASCPFDLPPPATTARWQDLAGMDALSPQQAFSLYYPAGQFVAALLRQSGADALGRLVAAYPFADPASQLPGVFSDVTGLDLDSFWNQVVQAGPNAAPCEPTWQCALPLDPGGGTWTDECSPYLTLPTSSADGLHLTASGSSFTTVACGSGIRDGLVLPVPATGISSEHWVMGGGADVAARPSPLGLAGSNASGTLAADTLSAPWATAACGGGAVVPLAADHAVYLHVLAGAGPLYVSVEAPDAGTSFAVATAATGTVTLDLCASCDAGALAACHSIDAGASASVTLQGAMVLRIGLVLPSARGAWLPIGFSPG